MTHLADDGLVRVRGARQHNLQGIDVDIPRDALVVFTGVSGSGKSSLAFGTIYAEAQRRYFESVAPYARRLLQQIGAPKVDDITGLPPAVALQQRRGAPSSRSTVGTITTLSNSLRMLISRAGTYPAGVTERLDSDAFSPNTAVGACPACHGIGVVHEATEASMVSDPSLTIAERAVTAWPGAWQFKNQRDILTVLGHDVHIPWRDLPQELRDWILFTDEQPIVTVVPERRPDQSHRPYQGTFMSARRYIMKALTMSQSAGQRRRALQFVETTPCPTCHGSRLRADALAVTFAGRSIVEWSAQPLRDLGALLAPTAELSAPGASYREAQSGETSEVARDVAADLVARVQPLVELGLGYLSLDRATPTLSPGELQRLRLATQVRSGLFGVVYVLDEPSAGLHPADTEPLLDVLDRIRATGNSLFVVEHDLDVMRRADWIVDIGPRAGEGGGELLYSGPVAGLRDVSRSITARHLFATDTEAQRTPRTPAAWTSLAGITRHNLVDLAADIPLGVFTAVTGVSGSGKSTLVTQVLAAAVARSLGTTLDSGHDSGDAAETDEAGIAPQQLPDDPAAGVAATGGELVDRLVQVDQRPIGRTPRSNLATYTGLFDGVRKLFASTSEAQARGYDVGRFSFNVAGGRCETCQGEGFVAVELLFLPGTYAPCPTCGGKRYNDETLEVTWSDMSVADVLALTVDAAVERFAGVKAVHRSLTTLRDVGLGYLRLGQPATELSGGEAQRIKLATELQRARRGHTMYLLDEPTTGLHPADVELLMAQLHQLVDAGNTVVVVEHDMGVVAGADWVIDMGPGGGDMGGQVVAAGTPAEVAGADGSRTAPYLRRQINDRRKTDWPPA
ncbi:MAG: excinuclease ABC subunit UvrA [Thermoleophilia bacterium]|nr:excinuclease ABC subunit UvrA [Thermoleophilia bacterium]